MKYLVLILILVTFQTKAQNLITNPSFEDIDSCYGGVSQIGFDVYEWTGCKGWSCPIASSSDLWCENGVFSNANPPDLFMGFQYPRTGENFAGLIFNDGIIFSYREYIQNELQQPLEPNITYKLSFYHSPTKTDCSTNQFGVLALDYQMSDMNRFYLSDISPSGVSSIDQFQGDTSTWNYCEIVFKASGGERFVVIGNFQDSTNATYALPCDTSFWGNLSYAGNYFYIDDVSLERLPMQLEIPNVFTPNDDGVNDFFSPTVTNYPNWEITILNRWGNEMTVLNENHPTWDGKEATEGVYFFRFECTEFDKIGQGYISVIR